VLLFALALLLRGWRLAAIPWPFGGDEASWTVAARAVLDGRSTDPFSTGWMGAPTLGFFFQAAWQAVFGDAPAGARLPWAVIGALTVVVAWALARELRGERTAWLTAGLLTPLAFHVHFSRVVVPPVGDALVIALALLFFERGRRGESQLAWALCGVTVGLGHYLYSGARFSLVLVAFLSAAALVRHWRRDRARVAIGMLVLWLAALATAAPLVHFALRRPADFFARAGIASVFAPGWLETQRASGRGLADILLDHFRLNALAFNLYHDTSPFYGAPRPILGLAAGVLFVLGLGTATARARQPGFLPLAAWWWGVIAALSFITGAPSYQRLATTAVPAAFFVAVALERIAAVVGRAVPGLTPRRLAGALALAVAVLGAIELRWYFGEYDRRGFYCPPNDDVGEALGKYAQRRLGPGSRVVLFGAPRLFTDFPSVGYYAAGVAMTDVAEPLRAPLSGDLAREPRSAFVFLPERADELRFVRARFPRGAIETVRGRHGEPLFVVYRPAASAAGT
jgi:4-amino-4-deoxy-L-arabinose transferase-like glycosyltransferase